MNPSVALATPARPRGWRGLLGRGRLLTTGITCTLIASLFMLTWKAPRHELWAQVFGIGLGLMLVFGLFEQWPRQLPRWLARWALQVLAVGAAAPLLTFIAYTLRNPAGLGPFWEDADRLGGFLSFTFLGMLLAPWIALAALVRQREAWAREQALAFELERSELARQALDARMRLLSAQVQPHFLFNTLANVEALVEAGSPRAAQLLQSLTAYLRAAVPRLDDAASTLGQELELVRAYLELMQMRMPDRLQFALHAAGPVLRQHCPPMTLLTLVENAVRHGIDPGIEGGRIDVTATLHDGRLRLCVRDTGVGLRAGGGSLGTGLAALRERLALVFGGAATLTLSEVQPHGVQVDVEWPASAAQGSP
jgi:signal transduction histidine kinase